jgi:hypothetical protein
MPIFEYPPYEFEITEDFTNLGLREETSSRAVPDQRN